MPFSQLETISASMSPPPIQEETLFRMDHAPRGRRLPPLLPLRNNANSSRGAVSTDIIDVDSLEDTQIHTTPRTERRTRDSHSHRHARPPVYTISSDEEGDQPVASGSGSHRADPPRIPDIIRPNAQPFPFESALEIPRAHSAANALPTLPIAAPRSHHVPSMGLGGGLISQHLHNMNNNSHASGSRVAARPLRTLPPRGGPRLRDEEEMANNTNLPFMRRVWDAVNPFGARPQYERPRSPQIHLHPLPAVDSDNEEEDMFLRDLLENGGGEEDYRFGNPERPYARNEMMLLYGAGRNADHGFPYLLHNIINRQQAANPEVDYKLQYTHSYPPDGKFTFDFAPEPLELEQKASEGWSEEHAIVLDDESEENKKSAAEPSSNALLVCARCQNPLVLNGSSGSDESSRNDKRVWVLQCGHLIDGKCANILMCPLLPETQSVSPVADAQPASPVTDTHPIDSKGKGKAKAILPDPESESHTSDADGDTSGTNTPHLSAYLSRLRSHTKRKQEQDLPETPRKRAKLARPRTRKMGGLDEYLWMCPVAECAREHASVRKRFKKGEWSEWETEKGLHSRGAIALFV